MSSHTSHSPPADESQMIQKAKSGDADAFGELYTQNMEAVFRFLYSRLGNRQDAEDLTEETFFRIWQSLPQFEDQGVPFLAFAFHIARNLLIDHRRRFVNSSTVGGLDDRTNLQPQPDAGDTALQNIHHEEIR
jgi:RNA polymerase sigma-70 factor (ECF subfamily)